MAVKEDANLHVGNQMFYYKQEMLLNTLHINTQSVRYKREPAFDLLPHKMPLIGKKFTLFALFIPALFIRAICFCSSHSLMLLVNTNVTVDMVWLQHHFPHRCVMYSKHWILTKSQTTTTNGGKKHCQLEILLAYMEFQNIILLLQKHWIACTMNAGRLLVTWRTHGKRAMREKSGFWIGMANNVSILNCEQCTKYRFRNAVCRSICEICVFISQTSL